MKPMLAHNYYEHKDKLKFPCYVQPKIDGIRCIAVINNGVCKLFSRNENEIHSLPHIVSELQQLFKEDVTLDGELYTLMSFEHVVSLVKRSNPHEQHKDVNFVVFDVVNNDIFDDRRKALENSPISKDGKYVRQIPSRICNDEADVTQWLSVYERLEYEGIILRNLNSVYSNKRSFDLLKLKTFEDEEFPIIDVQEGKGKLSGCVGAFVCKTKDGKIFTVKLSADVETLRNYFNRHSLWRGCVITVKHQGLTKNGIPRFPIGVVIRDYE